MTQPTEPTQPTQAPRPKQPKVPFELQAGEHVVLLAKRHWLYLAIQLVKYMAIALIPVAVVSVIVGILQGFDGTFGLVVLLIELAWVVFWAIKAYFAWFAYEHDLWVITNQRVVDSNRPNWFSSRIASADLTDVQDMSVTKNGIWQTMFNFGHVRCQTAGTMENFVITGVPNPQRVLQVVDTARDAARRADASAAR